MRSNLLKNSAFNAAAGMILLFTGLVSSIVVARLLGPEANGTIAFSLWLCTTGALIAEVGTGITMMRVLPQLKMRELGARQRKQFAAFMAVPVVIVTLVLWAVYMVLETFTDVFHGSQSDKIIIIITGILFIFQSIGAFSKNYFIGEQNLKLLFRTSTASSIIQFAVVCVGAYQYGIAGALIGYAAGQIVQFFSTLTVFTVKPSSCGMSTRFLFGASMMNFFEVVVASICLSRPEIFLLQKFQNIESVGYYAVSLSLVNLALQLPIQLTGSLLPYYSERQAAAQGKMPPEVFTTVVRNFSYLTLPLCFGLASISDPLVRFVFGPAFAQSGIIILILALGAPAAVFLQLANQYVLSLDRLKFRLATTSFGSVLMIVGCVAIIPYFGGEGAAIVRNLVLVAMSVVMVNNIELGSAALPLLDSVSRIGFSAALCGLAAYGITLEINGILGLIVAIPVAAIVYLLFLRITNAVTKDESAIFYGYAEKAPAPFRNICKNLIGTIVAR
jgi:O-antigen/teichoic acid export membrane protein